MADHISASQINRFLAEPALWLVEQLWGVKGTVGPGAWRGNACEAAMDTILFQDADSSTATAAALARFEQDAQGEIRDDIEKERVALSAYLANLLPVAKQLRAEKGIPLVRQSRIELELPGIRVAVVGYVDYLWDGCGLDLKTVGRSPSFTEAGRIKDKADHLRQMAIYNKAKGVPFSLLYATPTKDKPAKSYLVSDEEHDTAMRQIVAAARAMDKLLANANDRERLAVMFPPRDLNDYYWSDETRAVARKIWSL